MRVLYIDVYFLINFTVDMVALFISAKLLHIATSTWRILIISVLGALFAVADVFIDGIMWLTAIGAVSFLLCVGIIVSGKISIVTRARLVLVFLVMEMLLGGIVWYGYRLLDRYLGDISGYIEEGSVNRSALVFSVIVLFAIGVLKLFIMMFSKTTDIRSVRVRISVCGREIECEALVDSGNLVKDPMNMNPVIFLKRPLAEQLFPKQALDLTDIDALDAGVKRRIRLIPISRGGETHVWSGLLADGISFPEISENILSATLALDKEEGDYGGHLALVPSCLITK